MPRFSSSKSFEQIKRPRKLADRSHMSIEFPQSNGRVFRTYVPFLQNPIVSERGQSNLVEYDLVGRAGNRFAYGGAKSRVFNVSFTINLLHVLYTDHIEDGIDTKFLRQFNLFYADKERARKAFRLKPGGDLDTAEDDLNKSIMFAEKATEEAGIAAGQEALAGYFTDVAIAQKDVEMQKKTTKLLLQTQERSRRAQAKLAEAKGRRMVDRILRDEIVKDVGQDFIEKNKNNAPDVKLGAGFPHAQTHRTFYRRALGILTGNQRAVAAREPVVDSAANNAIELINAIPDFGLFGDAKTIPTPQDNLRRLDKLIDAVYVWINLIRASTMNNSTNTVQGCPIVRLTHGPMYNNIPCVVSDYSIEINQSAGYEVETLTPKEIQISMTLKETRTDGNFESNQIESGDHIAGWEAIIDNNNMDPYNGDITFEELQTFPETYGELQDGSFRGSNPS